MMDKQAVAKNGLVDPRPFYLEWYRKNGKHSERIVKDGQGRDYVIGDVSWNNRYPDKPEYIEYRVETARNQPTP
jgi:hypothetical protein